MRGHDEHVLVCAGSILRSVDSEHAVVGAVLQRESHRRAAVIKQRNTIALNRDAKAVHLAGGDCGCSCLNDLRSEVVERTALVLGAPTAPVVLAHGFPRWIDVSVPERYNSGGIAAAGIT